MGDNSLDAFLKGTRRSDHSHQAGGLKVSDILLMPSKQQSLMNWLMRRYEATLPIIAAHLDQSEDAVASQLEQLVHQGILKTVEKNGHIHYQVKLAPKSGRRMPKDVWQVLDSSNQQANVFISYSRRNKEFVQKLYGALEKTGREVWVDWENIPMAVDWWEEIRLGIELADTFIFVLSPDSVASKVCHQEIEEAIKHNKRLVPVVCQDVPPDAVHPQLARLNWIFLRAQDDFKEGVQGLCAALDQDVDYVRTHTRLLVRALEWDRNGRDPSYLLRGADLERANRYLAQGQAQAPKPSALHHQYVLASGEVESVAREAELEQQRQVLAHQRRWLQLITAASILSVALGLTSWQLSQEAHVAREEAERAQLRALTKSSKALFLSDQRFEALIEATQAGRLLQEFPPEEQPPDLQAQVMGALQQTLFWVQERNRLEGHQGTVWQVVFSPSGERIASASADGTIRLWALDGETLDVLECGSGPLLDVDFAPDEKDLVAVDADGNLFLWNSQSQHQQTWLAHTEPTRAVSFSPDGQYIATASEDATVKLWDREGNLVRTLRGDGYGLQTLQWSQDDRLIAGDERGRIYLWTPAGQRLSTFSNHQAAVIGLDTSSDGRRLASVGQDGYVNLYDLTSRKLANTFEAHKGAIYNIRFTPDNQSVITVGEDKLIHIWQLDEALSETLSETLVGHAGLITALALNPSGEIIATSGGDRAVRLWDLQRDDLHVLKAHQETVNAVAISPDSQLIASADGVGRLNLWNTAGELQRSLPGHSGAISTLAFSPDGTVMASASADGTAKLWQQFETDTPAAITLRGHTGKVNGVAFHPDGEHLATAGNDDSIRIWRLDGSPVLTLEKAHPDGVLSVAYSSDGQHLVSTGWDHRVRIWQVETLRTTPPKILEGHQGWVLDAQFSPDSQHLITASYDNTAKLWRVRDGKLLRDFQGHRDSVSAVAFSPSGDALFTASSDNTIRLWQVEDGTLITTLSGHTQGVRDIAIDPAAQFAVSASSDSTVLIWEHKGLNNIAALLHSSCNWLSDYLQHNNQIDPETAALCRGHIQMDAESDTDPHPSVILNEAQ